MKYFLNFKLDQDRNQNFKHMLGKPLDNRKFVVSEIFINENYYRSVKEFFKYFNYESNPKTFTEKIYNNYKFEKLRIITEEDLKIAFPESYQVKRDELQNIKNNGFLQTNFFKLLRILDFDIPTYKQINSKTILQNKPVEWNLFYRVIEDFIIKNQLNKSEINNNLKDFSILLENKDLDFEYYQILYKKTKRNIFYSTMRDILYSTRETNSNVLE